MSRYRSARDAQRCYVIAEAGSNHNRDWSLAQQLVEAAAAAAADAVKFQLFKADRLYPRDAGRADYLEDDADIYDVVASMELPEEWLPRLHALCESAGLDLLVTAFDELSVDAVDPYVPVHKLASYELTHEPLIRHIARTAKPLIMSTGGANEAEIEVAVAAAREGGANEVVLLQCTAAYPARLEALNVATIAGLRERFGVETGLSDHSRDPVIAPVLAVGLGAAVIEKHFTIDRSLPGPDHAFALEPDELRQLVEAVRAAETALGSRAKAVHADEEELRRFARRSIFTSRDLAAGEIFDAAAITVLRHGKRAEGLPPSALPSVVGRRARRAIAAGSPLQPDDVEF
jgi:sialic acid synthase SpsE